jgi:hypothetical protein
MDPGFRVWSRKIGVKLDQYLTDPKQFMPGTKMIYPGMKEAEQREAFAMPFFANLHLYKDACAIGGPGDAEHGDPMVGRGNRSVLEPDGNAHRSGKNLDCSPCQFGAQGEWNSCLPFRREGWRMAHDV